MRELFGSSLWPQGTAHPLRRMAKAMFISALLMSLLLTVFRVVVALVTGVRGPELYSAAMKAFEYSVYAVFGFTATAGLLGVGLLWALRWRNAVIWAILGGLLGAAAGFAWGAADQMELGTFAMFGWALFLTIRWQAGLKD